MPRIQSNTALAYDFSQAQEAPASKQPSAEIIPLHRQPEVAPLNYWQQLKADPNNKPAFKRWGRLGHPFCE